MPLHYLRVALAAHGVEAGHVKIWQTVGQLRRRHGARDERGAAGAGVPGQRLEVGGPEGEEYISAT
jgi:hypothetical protein